MNYWFVWPIGTVLWMALGWAEFAWFESRALKHDARKDQITLSFFLYTIGSKFPLSIALAGLMVGLFFGVLSTHILWHWCPTGSISEGMTPDKFGSHTLDRFKDCITINSITGECLSHGHP